MQSDSHTAALNAGELRQVEAGHQSDPASAGALLSRLAQSGQADISLPTPQLTAHVMRRQWVVRDRASRSADGTFRSGGHVGRAGEEEAGRFRALRTRNPVHSVSAMPAAVKARPCGRRPVGRGRRLSTVI